MEPNETSPGATDHAVRVERLISGYDLMMQQVAIAHAPEFLEVALTMSQAKVLYVVLASGGTRMSELAAKLGVSLSTTSGVVDRLVDHGLLDRHDDPADRRQVVVSITPDGSLQLDRFRELGDRQLRSILSRVADADLVHLERAFALLADAAALEAAANVAGAGQPFLDHPTSEGSAL